MELVSVHSRATTHLPAEVYHSITDFIVSRVREEEEISFNRLLDEALACKSIKFDRNPGWCLIQVKRDLEAKGVIQVIMNRRNPASQMIRLSRKRRSIL